MTSYKVWVEIEEIDENGDGTAWTLPDPIGEFDCVEAAEVRVLSVLRAFAPEEIAHSDQVPDSCRHRNVTTD